MLLAAATANDVLLDVSGFTSRSVPDDRVIYML